MLKERFDIDLQVRGVCGRKKMLLSDNLNETLQDSLIALDTANNSTSPFNELRKHLSSGSFKSSERLSELCESENLQQPSFRKIDSKLSLDQLDLYEDQSSKPVTADLDKFFEYITMSPSPHLIMIDTTDSPDVAKRHPAWLRGGAHVITSSKRALSASLDLYNEIIDARKANNRAYLSEVTIGASVPVITTLTDMLYSGDAVHSIVGIMSVSAGRIMTAMCEEGMSFSKALSLTYEQELFEEDVFTDLEGLESAYKVLILARTMGYPLNLKDIEIEPLATRRPISDISNCTEEFKAEDSLFAEKVKAAKDKGCTLRYVQRIKCTPQLELGSSTQVSMQASIKLEEVPQDSPIAQVKGAVYHFQFYTDRYSHTPLIIQGPLSDALNTASGLIGDLLRVARSLGASDQGCNIPLTSNTPESFSPSQSRRDEPTGLTELKLNNNTDQSLEF